MKPQMYSPGTAQRGVALIITLFFLVLVSVVVIGFLDTARLDRAAAGSHFERMRATTMAQEGIETVAATLQRETGDRPIDVSNANYIPRNWVTQPGALTVTSPDNRTRLTTKVALSSGLPSPTYLDGNGVELVMRPPDLNTELLVDQNPPTHLLNEQVSSLTNKIVPMKVRWVYVRKDGTYDLGADGLPIEAPTTTNTVNPIVGRFAYWTDDESAKINYNLAWTRDANLNPNPPGHQTKIDLRALAGFTDSIANGLHSFVTGDNYTTIKRFYNTPFTARLENDAATRAALDLHKFDLTHFNSDPDTTYYGRSRMMLTTQMGNAALRDATGNIIMDGGKPVTRPFLDILKNPSNSTTYIDPGATASSVDAGKLNTVVNDLVKNYLKRSDWPMVDGDNHSIQEKYYSSYNTTAREQRLAQIALNIVDYVRSSESRRTVVQPIRAKWISGIFTPDFADSTIVGTEDTFKGLTRAPHITEQGVWVADKPDTAGNNIGRYHCYFFVEIYLPENYGIDTLDLLNTDGKKWSVYISEISAKIDGDQPLYFLPDGTAATNEYTVTNPRTATSPTFIWEARSESSTDVLKPTSKTKIGAGQYRTFVMEAWRAKSKAEKPTVAVRSAITVSGGPRIDVAPLSATISYVLDVPPKDGTIDATMISSYETADPRVNGLVKDWTKVPLNSMGAVNTTRLASLDHPISVTPQQDMGSDGKVSAASLRMPYPYGNAKNATGRVRSPGELGLIHTGIEGSSSAPKPGVPWRSLRLQPSSQGTTVVPDWAFMDLFTVPVDVPVAASALFSPHSTSTGGRVNINAKPDPFDLDRVDPLVAVLSGVRTNSVDATTLSLDDAKTVARHIYNHDLAKGAGSLSAGKAYPAASGSAPVVYESPGEIAEVEGIADRGEESEELIREIANLVTARGNVFSVYTVGQALKQTPAGKLVVTGEQRQQAVLERYLVGKGTTTPNDDTVALRTIYMRDLTP